MAWIEDLDQNILLVRQATGLKLGRFRAAR